LLGLLAWAGLTVLGALPDQSTKSERIFHDVLQAMGAVFFALAVGGGLLGWWQQKEWKRRTQWIAFDLLNQAMRQTALIASRTADLWESGPGPTNLVGPVFRLPWTRVGNETIEEVGRFVAAELAAAVEEGRAADAADDGNARLASVARKLQGLAPQIEAHADRLRQLTVELGAYLDDVLAVQLVTDVAELHDAVRNLVDPLPGWRVPEDAWALLAGEHAKAVLNASGTAAESLTRAYDRLETQGELGTRIEDARASRSEEDQSTVRELKAWREFEETERKFLEAEAGWEHSGEMFLKQVDELLNSPDINEETLRQVQDAIEQVGSITEDVKQSLSEGESDTEPEDEHGDTAPEDEDGSART
jgi:hypothetical protein